MKCVQIKKKALVWLPSQTLIEKWNEMPDVLMKLKKIAHSNEWVKEEIWVIVDQGKAIIICGLPNLSYGNWHHV